MSATRPRPGIRDDFSSGGSGAAKIPGNRVSAEGRQRLSELAKARHAAGGFEKSPDGGSAARKRKPSRKRIAQLVAMAALEEKTAQDIVDVFKDGIHSSQPITVRLKAAEAWLKVEGEEAKLSLREQDVDDQKRGRGELLDLLSEKLTQGHGALMLRRQIEEQVGLDPAARQPYDIEGQVVE